VRYITEHKDDLNLEDNPDTRSPVTSCTMFSPDGILGGALGGREVVGEEGVV